MFVYFKCKENIFIYLLINVVQLLLYNYVYITYNVYIDLIYHLSERTINLIKIKLKLIEIFQYSIKLQYLFVS